MKFIDEAELTVEAGHGGAGSRSFRREKFVPLGGPDGGDGGKGGSVILTANVNVQTLLDFRFQPRWKAMDGKPGQGSGKEGKSGEDLIINVPVGTQILNSEGKLVADLAAENDQVVLAKGGRGGRGNEFFKSATNRAPEHTQPGEVGERGSYKMSLKLVADVGLIGFPNAGKSTLISRISKARPKIADYPFTTLVPNLGVARSKGGSTFVVADIPGLIPGANLGKGLGIKFLKHVERTKLLVHLLDPHQLDVEGNSCSLWDSYRAIRNELKAFSKELAKKPEIIVITKVDTIQHDKKLKAELLKQLSQHRKKALLISSLSSEGLDELLEQVSKKLAKL